MWEICDDPYLSVNIYTNVSSVIFYLEVELINPLGIMNKKIPLHLLM